MAVHKARLKGDADEGVFWRLDNSAVFLAAVAGSSGPLVYRFSLDFIEPLRLEELKDALLKLSPRFPFFFVALRYGVFWHYLDPLSHPPSIEPEGIAPAEPMPLWQGRPLVRVIPYGRRLSVEFHHAVTDGTGATTFLRALAVQYLLECGVLPGPEGLPDGLPQVGQTPEAEEEEDAYRRYFPDDASAPDKTSSAWLLPGKRRYFGYRHTVLTLPLTKPLTVAKERSLTLTEYLVAVYLAAMQDVYEAEPLLNRNLGSKIIRLQVPVNLRTKFPSRTLRNFFLFAACSIDMRLGHWDFDEICRHVHHQMRLGSEKKELTRHLRRNVGGERNPLARSIVLPIKNIVLRIINNLIGIWAYSGSLSNMGSLTLPEPFDQYINGVGFVPSRSRSNGLNIGVLSWKHTLYISIGSQILNTRLEQRFAQRLTDSGLEVHVDCNEAYTESLSSAAASRRKK